MRKLIFISLLFIGLSGSSCTIVDTKPQAVGYTLGITYLEAQPQLSPEQVESCEIVYKTLDKLVGPDPSPGVGLTAAMKLAGTYAKANGAPPTATLLAEQALKDIYKRLRNRYGFLESDRQTQLRILRNLRNGIRQALEDYGTRKTDPTQTEIEKWLNPPSLSRGEADPTEGYSANII